MTRLLKRAVELLDALEWSAWSACEAGSYPATMRACPSCAGVDPSQEDASVFFLPEKIGHLKTCPLGRFLVEMHRLPS